MLHTIGAFANYSSTDRGSLPVRLLVDEVKQGGLEGGLRRTCPSLSYLNDLNDNIA